MIENLQNKAFVVVNEIPCSCGAVGQIRKRIFFNNKEVYEVVCPKCQRHVIKFDKDKAVELWKSR